MTRDDCTTLIPWHRFTKWQNGRHVLLLQMLGASDNKLPIPLSSVSQPDADAIRRILTARLGAPFVPRHRPRLLRPLP